MEKASPVLDTANDSDSDDLIKKPNRFKDMFDESDSDN